MEIEEAIKISERFVEVTQELTRKAKGFDKLTDRVEDLRSTVSELNKGIRKLQADNRILTMLAKGSNLEVCEECAGEGGFDCGEHSEECPVCQTSCVLPKGTNDKLKNRSNNGEEPSRM